MVPDAPWPTGGEIDIVERLNYEPFVHHTVHSTYTQAGKKTLTSVLLKVPLQHLSTLMITTFML